MPKKKPPTKENFIHALLRLLDDHQEEFEKTLGSEVTQSNQINITSTDGDATRIQIVLKGEESGFELSITPIGVGRIILR